MKGKGKREMKKSLIIFVFLLILMSFSSIRVSAKTTVTLFEQNEIKDLNVLYKLAKSNEKGKESKKAFTSIQIFKDGKEDLESFKTLKHQFTQKLKSELLPNGEINTLYVTTSFFVVIDDGGGGGGTNPPSYTDSQYTSDWDGSIGVKAYSTIYYNVLNINSREYTEIVKVTGGWTVTDYLLSIESKTVKIGQSNIYTGTQVINYNNVGNTFTFYRPSYWQPVETNFDYQIGAITKCTIVRGPLSSWELVLSNTLSGSSFGW